MKGTKKQKQKRTTLTFCLQVHDCFLEKVNDMTYYYLTFLPYLLRRTRNERVGEEYINSMASSHERNKACCVLSAFIHHVKVCKQHLGVIPFGK